MSKKIQHRFMIYKAIGKNGRMAERPLGHYYTYVPDLEKAKQECIDIWNRQTSGVKVILVETTARKIAAYKRSNGMLPRRQTSNPKPQTSSEPR